MKKYSIALAMIAALMWSSVVGAADALWVIAVTVTTPARSTVLYYGPDGSNKTFESEDACKAFIDSSDVFKNDTDEFRAVVEAQGGKLSDPACTPQPSN